MTSDTSEATCQEVGAPVVAPPPEELLEGLSPERILWALSHDYFKNVSNEELRAMLRQLRKAATAIQKKQRAD